jgi:hypothetical protein
MNLDSLPKKESRKAYLTKKHGDMWNLHHFDHSWHRSDKNDYVWVKVKRVIKKYMGKSFDEAFSYFCTLVPKHEQSEFLKEFENAYGWYEPQYIIDDNGNIQINKNSHRYKKKKDKSKESVIFYSIDYEEGWYDTITKKIYNNKEFSRLHYDMFPTKNFIKIVICGYSKEFESKKDKEYIRLMKEKAKQKKLFDKYYKKEKRKKDYSFLTDDEKRKIEERQTDLIKRDSHGFDDESFKGYWYHGQKRKENK